MNKTKNLDINNLFRKICINRLPSFEYGGDGISKRPAFYRRDDLHKLAKEAFERGEDEFYYERKVPDDEYSELISSEPKYVYRLDHDLTVEEYEMLRKICEEKHQMT